MVGLLHRLCRGISLSAQKVGGMAVMPDTLRSWSGRRHHRGSSRAESLAAGAMPVWRLGFLLSGCDKDANPTSENFQGLGNDSNYFEKRSLHQEVPTE